MNSTSHAAPVCEPKKRDARPRRCGFCTSRMTVKTASADEHQRPRRSPRRTRDPRPLADHRDAEVRSNSAPNASTIVSAEDAEAPEREGVRQARDASTPAACADRRPRRPRPAAARPGLVGAAHGRLPAADQPGQPPQPPPGDHRGGDEHEQAQGQARGHGLLRGRRGPATAEILLVGNLGRAECGPAACGSVAPARRPRSRSAGTARLESKRLN